MSSYATVDYSYLQLLLVSTKQRARDSNCVTIAASSELFVRPLSIARVSIQSMDSYTHM
jgi:hypothetical protein